MIPQLTPEEAAQALRKKPATVYLDVRSVEEFRAGHPAGAYNVPIVFFDAAHRPIANTEFARVVQAAFATDAPLLVGCQSGVRSQHAAERLRALGFTEVANVAGGFGGSPAARGWRDSGLPVERGDPEGRSYAELEKRR
jgi:rhodanese-related sulfurtransferase